MTKGKFVIAAPHSGSGKTLLTCAMISAYTQRGLSVAAYKCGPDYIDPLYHEKILGIPTGNLDLFFTDEDTTRSLFDEDNNSDLSIIEGVMGLYDGVGGITDEASTYHLAKTLRAPILLIVDAKGMGRSLLALIRGFLAMDEAHLIAGVVLNRMTENYYRKFKPVIEQELQIKVFGYIPVMKDIQLESRYLGLKLPWEIEDIRNMAKEAGERLANTVDLDDIRKMAEAYGDPECIPKALSNTRSIVQEAPDKPCTTSHEHPIRIAVAGDEAFCFIYRDNIRMLKRLGTEILYFSPLQDEKLPDDICGVILYGGYPELHAKRLSENQTMLKSIREAAAQGIPILAECGGFMYLHDSVTDKEGTKYPMAGVIGGNCSYAGHLVRFGYVKIREKEPRLLPEGEELRAHEFHYFDSTDNGSACLAVKAADPSRQWDCMHVTDTIFAGYPHLYYPANPVFAERFVERCRHYNKEKIHNRNTR